MVNRTRELAARDMPTAEEFALWGARELSFEELLAVNGGGNVEGAGPVCGADPDIPDNPGVPNEAEETSPTQGGGAPSVDCTPPSNTGSSDSGDSHGSGSTGGSSVITGSSYTVQEKDTLSDIVRRR
ncbi:hypothetical protein H0R92_13990, partial [Treponema sp. OMZ 840]|uniref:hypothetical protein n=1 Tax=Treponema sp. OMZ 840 TaxID=244313 RepID=UPI003D8FA50D